MSVCTHNPATSEISQLLRGEGEAIARWNRDWDVRRLALHLTIIVLGSGSYGAAMGWWRAPEQALFVAIKLPLIILLVTAGNALINGMLAPLLGLNLRFRESVSAIVMSFTVMSVILAAFSPVVAFFVWSLSGPAASPETVRLGYSFFLLLHVVLIALAGIVGNVRLFQFLRERAGERPSAAQNVLAAWLAVNLFLGSQLGWILRPFIGSPNLDVEFFRPNALQGNFYEAVWNALKFILT